jgi:hypothetical protein
VDAIGVLGDALQGFGGGKGSYVPMLLAEKQQRREIELAESERQRNVADWIAKQRYSADHPEPTALERNVAAFQNFTPEQRAVYGQMQEAQQGPVTLTLPGNRIYSGPRSGLPSALGAQQPENQPTIQNTPAPTMGANGTPSYLTPEQYKAVEASMGPERTAAWAAQHRIPIAKSVNGKTYYQIGGDWYDNPEGR